MDERGGGKARGEMTKEEEEESREEVTKEEKEKKEMTRSS